MIGALVYFLQSAESSWDYVLAFPKAVVWPALLVYKLFKSYGRPNDRLRRHQGSS